MKAKIDFTERQLGYLLSVLITYQDFLRLAGTTTGKDYANVFNKIQDTKRTLVSDIRIKRVFKKK